MVTLSVVQLRTVLQLFERPYEDVFDYDGSSYYNLTQREPCTILRLQAQAGGSTTSFGLELDYGLNYGYIDFSAYPAGRRPDLNSVFFVDYTYSRLSAQSASTAAFNATLTATMDYGSMFPYGSTTAQGIAYNDLATFGASLIAAREACYTLANTEIELAQKSRRGAILFDDSKKTEDWSARAKEWDKRYERYKTMIRGTRTFFDRISQSTDASVFGYIGREVFDNLGLGVLLSNADGGVF